MAEHKAHTIYEQFALPADPPIPDLPNWVGITTISATDARRLYTDSQMRAYARQAALEERERCAALCELPLPDIRPGSASDTDSSYRRGLRAGLFGAAEAIRKQGKA